MVRRLLSTPILWFVWASFSLACWKAAATAKGLEDQSALDRLKIQLGKVIAIDTHSHLRSFRYFQETAAQRQGFTLQNVLAVSYLGAPPWTPGDSFDQWWQSAHPGFERMRAASCYRYLLPSFRDLYGVDFETITPDQARRLNDQITRNYRSEDWVCEVVTRRAGIELMLIDTYWSPLRCERYYRFMVPVLRIDPLLFGTHPDQYAASRLYGKFANPYIERQCSPYAFAEERGLKIRNLDDYLAVVDAIFRSAIEHGAVSIKSAMAYMRTIRFDEVSRQRAENAFGKRPGELTPAEQKDFEDFMFWQVTKLSARYNLPFQIHTGWGQLQGSNPMLLADLIEANPGTKFILFHGGYPWIGETGAIAKRYSNVWIDSVWMPVINYTMARRAYEEWLDAVASDRILWGSDEQTPDGVYGATQTTRRCLAEALAEKVQRGELREADALRIGRQILRENALRLFPRLKERLPPATAAPAR